MGYRHENAWKTGQNLVGIKDEGDSAGNTRRPLDSDTCTRGINVPFKHDIGDSTPEIKIRDCNNSLGMTRKQSDLLGFIRAYHTRHGVPPSYQEMADHLGYKSKAAAHKLVHALVQRGQVTMRPGSARSIKPVGAGITVRTAARILLSTCSLSRTTRAEIEALVGMEVAG